MKCPICGLENEDNWPVTTASGKIEWGGCCMCWEAESSDSWFEAVISLEPLCEDKQ